jgi:hypothetical protein
MSHIPNDKQIKAFNALIANFKKCNKLGLKIYAKQWCLVAYTLEADEYAERTNESLLRIGSFGAVPFISGKCLADSGADDYANYITEKDQLLFNPDSF